MRKSQKTSPRRSAAQKAKPELSPKASASPSTSFAKSGRAVLGSTHDLVSHPDHYGGKDNDYETIKVMEARLTTDEFIGAMKFQVYKYNDRHRDKDGLRDLRKSKFYQDYLVDYCVRKGIDI